MKHHAAFCRHLVESTVDMALFVLCPGDGFRFVFVNDAACRHFGSSREELLVSRISRWDRSFASEQQRDGLWREIRERKSIRIETEHRIAPDRLIPIALSFSYMEHAGDEFVAGMLRDIDERSTVHALLRTRERYQRALLDNFPFPVWLKDTESRFLAVNRPFAAAAGIQSSDALTGKTDLDVWPSDLAQRYRVDDQEVLRSRQKKYVEEPIEEQGVRNWFETYKAPVEDADGTLLGTVGFARDITGRKWLDDALRASEAAQRRLVDMQKSILDALPANIVLIDNAGIIVAVNRRWEQFAADNRPMFSTGGVGCDYLEILGLAGEPGAAASPVPDGVRRVLHGECAQYEHEYPCHALPQTRWFRVHAVPLVADARMGAVIIHTDVTRAREAEALLHAREQEFRALVENSPDIVVRYDRQCRRVYVNPATQKTFNIPAVALLGRAPDDISVIAAARVQSFHDKIRAVLETGQAEEIDLSWEVPGDRFFYHIRFVPEYDREGRVATVLAIGRDVRTLKETEGRLKESRTLLRELGARREAAREDERKRIAREIHDELGQFLTVLRLKISLLRSQFGKHNPALLEKVQGVMELTDKTIGMVRDIASALRPAALDMGIVSALEWLAEEFTGHTGIAHELRINEDEIDLDEGRATVVFRIVQESLTNVIRHSGANRVEIALVRGDDAYVLKVRDNGTGFDPDKPKGKNSFGLVGIRERALMLGGDIAVYSAPWQGTMLEVRIPIHEVSRGES